MARPSAKRAPALRAAPAAKPTRAPASKRPGKSVPAAPPAPAESPAPLRNPDERRHVLSLSFVRDGDEFLARIETDTDHIVELKNRSLDQLLTLVASELEDLLP
ncbi:MAG TPA: hypothetical protein VKT21_00385 [Thermoplasmata archaeon]|nr:hypothetical protein [Thermoplasmata archaeon]